MDYLTLVLEAALLMIITVYAYFYWKYKDFPPGPYGLPVLGYVPFMGTKQHVTLRDLSKKYGPILSANIGNNQAVFVNDWESIREVLVKQGGAFRARPYVYTFEIMTQGRDNDIVATSGPVQKALKIMSMKIMKEFGLGGFSLENVIIAEVERLATHLKTLDGQLVDVGSIFFIPILNIVWGMTTGITFDVEDAEMKSFADALHVLGSLSTVAILNIWPFLRFVAPELTGYKRFNDASKKILAYIDKIVDERMEVDAGQKNADFIQRFIEQIKMQKVNKDQPPYCKNYLNGAVLDMFLAGVESSDTTLFWSFLLMAYHPDVQEKVQRELDMTIAEHSHLSYSSKSMIPYTEATLCEVQRFASVVPLALPHCATKDTTLLGYKIPKGTTVFANLWAINHDEEFWRDASTFRPERFLDAECQLSKPDRFIPFSAGPRACFGKELAGMELILFFSGLMRRFSFQMNPNHPRSESVLDPITGIILKPRPISLVVKCR